ncbi:MAG: hypothetical protein HY678_06295 [Chloroflexi bacterium]|nr:hypothetical protein [Chloroflexota bacterium]
MDYHLNRTGHSPVADQPESPADLSRDGFLAMCGEAYDELAGQVAGVQFLTQKTLQAMSLPAAEATGDASTHA